MSRYHEVVYDNYKKSTYPRRLVWKLIWDYMRDARRCNVPPRASILDVGCGTGEYLAIFDTFGFEAYGIDSEVDLNKDKIPYRDNRFSYVFTKSTIEHVYNTDHFLSEIRRVLKPGGKVIILLPSWEYNYKVFYDDYTHVKPFHRKGLQDAMKINGFKDVSVTYFYHLPWLWKPGTTTIKKYVLPVVWFLRLFPKWKNKEENIHRPNIRFAQEVQLLGVASK